ncbi:hypothetical protein [Bacillus thuringiensis]|uniref:hypothetical protein n=1 Tax=Bacillus thuringiensis TaxID=1428 RepID=UPI001596E5EC|nr:hypothetical protein [Bacillus thuringiensis]
MARIEEFIKEGFLTFEKYRMMDNFVEECEMHNLTVEVSTDEDGFYVVMLKK